MRVVLCAPPIMDRFEDTLESIAMDAHRECPPYGMYLLRAALLQAGHHVDFADLIALGTSSVRGFSAEIDRADLVGIGATSMSWPTAIEVLKQIRHRRPDVPVVVGGIHPTMFDQYVLSAFPVQFVVRGEGEAAIVALANALEGPRDFHEVPNLSWKTDDGVVVRNSIEKLIRKDELTDFPVPDYGDLPDRVYQALSIESSRGCVFDCSFCSTSYRRTWRGIQPEEFVDRLEMILPHVPRTSAGHIHIIDDEFSMNVKRATRIAQIISQRGLDAGLVYDSRANDICEEAYVEAMAPHTVQFLVGAECGYDEGLALIGKGTTCAKLEEAARILRKFGIADRADFSFVLGLPWEGRAEVERTIAFATHLHATYGVRVLLQWYCQIPGSRLWDEAARNGLVTEAMYDEFGFFSNYYLFQSGVKIPTADIYAISDKVAAVRTVSQAVYKGRNMIEYAFPEPVAKYFPRILETFQQNGLASLRQVAGPGSQAARREIPVEPPKPAPPGERIGIPLRHFHGVHDKGAVT